MQYVLSSVIVAKMYVVNCQLNFVYNIQMLQLHAVKICMHDSDIQQVLWLSFFYWRIWYYSNAVLNY